VVYSWSYFQTDFKFFLTFHAAGLFYEFGAIFAVASIFVAECALFTKRKELFLTRINNYEITSINIISIFNDQFVLFVNDFLSRWTITFLFAFVMSVLFYLVIVFETFLKNSNWFLTLWLVIDAALVIVLLFSASTVTQNFQDIYDHVYSKCCMRDGWDKQILTAMEPLKNRLGFRLLEGRNLTRTWLAVWFVILPISFFILLIEPGDVNFKFPRK